jgi:ferredoxin-nitrite reductase
VKAEAVPAMVERLLKSYLAGRATPGETFLEFARRHDVTALRNMVLKDMTLKDTAEMAA